MFGYQVRPLRLLADAQALLIARPSVHATSISPSGTFATQAKGRAECEALERERLFPGLLSAVVIAPLV